MRVGQLATLNSDPYFNDMPEAEWFVQVWSTTPDGKSKRIVARFYGSSPDEVRAMAEDYVKARADAAGEEKK